MSANNDPISKALNLSPMPKTNHVANLLNNALNDSARSDFELARTNLHEIINTGLEAIEKLSQVADLTQHPRAYEVIAKLIETVAAANKSLLELQTTIRNIDMADAPSSQSGSITNNLFVGSTSELQKVLNQLKKNE
ncbi:MAG: hypothetical protein ACXV2C_04405 [Candidatus Bathyarchaeia archaeon]